MNTTLKLNSTGKLKNARRLKIDFGANGTSSAYKLSGWATPEADFTWTDGFLAELKIPARPGNLLCLKGYSFTHPPDLLGQTVIMRANGLHLETLWIDGRFTKWLRIPFGIEEAKSDILLQIELPDAVRPSEERFGTDDRRLGIALTSLEIIDLKAGTPREAPLEVDPQFAPSLIEESSVYLTRVLRLFASGDQSEAARLLQDTKWLTLAAASYLQELRPLLVEACLVTRQLDLLKRVLSGPMGRANVTFHISAESCGDPSVIVCHFKSPCYLEIYFASSLISASPIFKSIRHIVCVNFSAVLELVSAYAGSDLLKGHVRFNLGDEAHCSGVAFCAWEPNVKLIPDPAYLLTKGYQAIKAQFQSLPSWGKRRPKLFWRGASTGYRSSTSILDLPRVKVAVFCQTPPLVGISDVGISSVVQTSDHATDVAILKMHRVMRPRSQVTDLLGWQMHLDIDGNSNSWSGLYTKLLSGGVVLKVWSSMRQWYYDKLIPFKNIIPVSADLSDLAEKAQWVLANPGFAEQIGMAGRSLAYSLDHRVEWTRALETIQLAVLEQSLLDQEESASVKP